MLLILGLAGFNIFLSKMQAFGLFRGKMSSWCSFRCPCLDELGSKSDLNILYLFLLQNTCFPCFSHCEAHGWFYLAWRLLWCCDLVHDKMRCLLLISKTFAGFNVADFRWSRWIQYFFLSKTQAFGVFRGKMSSWCSFRCPCLDELGSKSDLNILYLFCCCCCKMCACHVIRTVRLMGDWFCSGGFFGVVIGFVFNICIC